MDRRLEDRQNRVGVPLTRATSPHGAGPFEASGYKSVTMAHGQRGARGRLPSPLVHRDAHVTYCSEWRPLTVHDYVRPA